MPADVEVMSLGCIRGDVNSTYSGQSLAADIHKAQQPIHHTNLGRGSLRVIRGPSGCGDPTLITLLVETFACQRDQYK
jgi:hypothetical protein